MQEAVAGIVIRPAPPGHEILLLKRATKPFLGQWFPVEGRIEPEEEPMAAVLRELSEETQLSAVTILYESTRIVPSGQAAVRIHIFAILVVGCASVSLNEEHDEYRWCSLDEAATVLPLPAQRDALSRIRERFLTTKTE